jgi:hypothetical protein
MKTKFISNDPDTQGSFAALRRAAKRARKLAEETGTPFYVWKDGKVVNLNPVPRKRRKKTS